MSNIAKSKESIGKVFIDLCDEVSKTEIDDSKTEDGDEVNIRFGKGKTQKKILLKRSRKQLTKKTTMDTFNQEISEDKRYKVLTKLYHNAIIASDERRAYLSKIYSKKEMFYIQQYLAYLKNIYDGYGHYNDEIYYQEIRKKDITGKLYQEALASFEISKRDMDIAKEMREVNIRRCVNKRKKID